MRRPSTEQNEDDLNRLTASASVRSNESVNSQQTVVKVNNNINSNNNDNNNNSKNNSSNYLPNIIIANAEYQQQCRKRKDRQDSTSSITQDRKVVRSSSEEHVPSCQDQDQSDAIRRVSSHEDFNLKPLPLQEHNENDDNVIKNNDELKIANENAIEHDEINNQSSGELTFSKNNLIDVSTPSSTAPQVIRLSPTSTTTNEFLEENERRRYSERFLKTKSPSGRKSPRRSRKSSPLIHRDGSSQNGNLDWNNKDESKENNDEVDDSMPNSSPVLSRYPWESAEDKPIVCQRFAENTFDHVHHSISKFIKHDHDLVKYNLTTDDEDELPYHLDNKKDYRNFLSAENVKTRDMHQKSRSPQSTGNSGIFQTPDERIRQINKRLTSLKKKISAYEESFETNYGYRPSHADKSSDKNIKNYIAEIHKLRKEKSQIKADPMTAMGYKNKFDDSISVEKKMSKIKESLHDIEKVRLSKFRYEFDKKKFKGLRMLQFLMYSLLFALHLLLC